MINPIEVKATDNVVILRVPAATVNAVFNATGKLVTVAATGFAAVMFDGYDLIVYGAAIPALLTYDPWSLTPTQAGAIGGYTLIGMFLGAIASGTLSDRFGRRRLFIASLAWFSAMMVLVSLAPSPWSLGLFRFLAGLGLGGVPPAAIALAMEVAPAHRRHLLGAVLLCGFPIGGLLAAALAMALLEPLGFRVLFALGTLPLITLVPLALWLLPESPAFDPNSTGADRHPIRKLLTGRPAIATSLFTIAKFSGFLLIYALNTWLPELMRAAGYQLGAALTFLLALNAGALAGGLAGSALADRLGARWISTLLFLLAAAVLGLVAIPMPTPVRYLLVFCAGAATSGNLIVIFGYVATHYPAATRATALGLIGGTGRLGGVAGPILGGAMISAGLALDWHLGVLAAIAVWGAIACALVPPDRAPATAVARRDR